MSSEDRDLLIEAVTTLKFVQKDICELKHDLKAERVDVGKLKLKIYTFSGLINGFTVAVNIAYHLWTKLPQHTS